MDQNPNNGSPGDRNPLGHDDADHEQPVGMAWLTSAGNMAVLKRFGLFVVIAMLVGSVAPAAITPVMVGNMMLFAGLATVIIALLSGEGIGQRMLGRWDEAAGYLLVALIAAQAVDPAALEALQQQMVPPQ